MSKSIVKGKLQEAKASKECLNWIYLRCEKPRTPAPGSQNTAKKEAHLQEQQTRNGTKAAFNLWSYKNKTPCAMIQTSAWQRLCVCSPEVTGSCLVTSVACTMEPRKVRKLKVLTGFRPVSDPLPRCFRTLFFFILLAFSFLSSFLFFSFLVFSFLFVSFLFFSFLFVSFLFFSFLFFSFRFVSFRFFSFRFVSFLFFSFLFFSFLFFSFRFFLFFFLFFICFFSCCFFFSSWAVWPNSWYLKHWFIQKPESRKRRASFAQGRPKEGL